MFNYKQLTYIFQNAQALIAVFGIIGNILIIRVFLSKNLRNNSYSFYSIIMMFADTIVLLHSIRHWSALILNSDIDLVSSFLCAIGEYQPYVAGTLSQILLALISFDRLITIVYPSRFKIFKKRWFQVVLVFVLISYSMLIHIQLPLYSRLITVSVTNNDTAKTLVCYISDRVSAIHTWIFLANIFIVIIIVNNILVFKIIVFLVSSRRRITAICNQRFKASITKDHKFAVCAIGLSLSCMLCKTPLSIGILLSYYFGLSHDQMQLIFTILVLIYTIDNGAGFVIYMCVNSVFYEEFMKMIRIKKSLKRPAKIDIKF